MIIISLIEYLLCVRHCVKAFELCLEADGRKTETKMLKTP